MDLLLTIAVILIQTASLGIEPFIEYQLPVQLTAVPLKNIILYTNGDRVSISQRLHKPRHESVTSC